MSLIVAPRLVKLTTRTEVDIKRSFPQPALRRIGAWVFLDHFGPTKQVEGMVVARHPHTGLQTVTWPFAGIMEHRDSVGSVQLLRPSELNLMTAGSGISINAGTISATGLTTNNIASNAAIANGQLANSATTLGTTTMTLGGTVSSVVGLNLISANTIIGTLSGTASSATNLAGGSVGAIPYQSAAGTTALLAGNTTSTVKYLASSGNGTNSSAPTWVTPSFVPYSGATGAVTITNTGATSIVAGTNIAVSGATGAVTVTFDVFVEVLQISIVFDSSVQIFK